MARAIKLSDQNKPWAMDRFKRKSGSRQLRQRILIVCEGVKTEPNYFISISQSLPKHLVELEIQGEGANTLGLVQIARQLRDEFSRRDQPFDQVWIVFDRDSFPPDAFDNAILSAEADKMNCAWSNEAFELWYILHFIYRSTAMNRKDYGDKLSELLGEKYRKNDPAMYEKLALKGNQKQAIACAKKLIKNAPPSRANPCTTVYKLVELLNTFLTPPSPTSPAPASLNY